MATGTIRQINPISKAAEVNTFDAIIGSKTKGEDVRLTVSVQD